MGHLFVWDPQKYSLHIGPMDADHQKIIASMNRLHELHDAHANSSQLSRALAELLSITVKHFNDEEAYMDKIGFPELARHKLIHKSLLDQIQKHEAQLDAAGELTDEFFSFLGFWLKSHICGIDRKYSTFSHTGGSA